LLKSIFLFFVRTGFLQWAKMAEEKVKKGVLGFKYERKRIKREKKLSPLCRDYEPVTYSNNCQKAKYCKNATYGREGKADGICFGGTDDEERKNRQTQKIEAKVA